MVVLLPCALRKERIQLYEKKAMAYFVTLPLDSPVQIVEHQEEIFQDRVPPEFQSSDK
jgi:hypothetical protein